MKPIVVLDTNIHISSIFWDGGPYAIAKMAIDQNLTIFSSNPILDEIRKVLKRDFALSKQEIEDVIVSLMDFTNIVEPTEKLNIIKDDPPDDRILECAVSCKAQYIVSYNNHLLKLKEFRGIKILVPKDFLVIIRKK